MLKSLHWCGLVAAFLLLAPAARADKIDEGLIKNAGKVLDTCQKAGYVSVGILKFEVQVGKNPPSMRVGRFNSMMATKLENALIVKLNPNKPLNITRGASARAAQKDVKATYATPEGRSKLFEYTYLRAWAEPSPKANPEDLQLYEDKFLKVNAFLTGLVKVNYSTLKSTVSLKLFDSKNPSEVRDIVEFDAALDRQMLADLNVAVTVVRRDADTDGIVIDPDKIKDIKEDPKPKTDPEPKPKPEPEPKLKEDEPAPLVAVVVPTPGPSGSVQDLLEFNVYYDGKLVKWGQHDGLGKLVQPPLPGQTIHFTVKSHKKVGMVLRVNGIATWGYLRDRDLPDLPMWVLEPGQEYTIEGFYPSRTKVLPFKAVPAHAMDPSIADSAKLGFIDIDLFYGASETPNVKMITATGRSTNLRTVTARMNTLEELQTKVVKLGVTVTKKEFLDADPSRAGVANVEHAEFQRGVPGPRLTIQYELAPKKNGGLIPD